MGSWSDATGRRRVVAIEDLEMAAEEAGEVEAAEGEVEATQKAAEVAAEEEIELVLLDPLLSLRASRAAWRRALRSRRSRSWEDSLAL